MNEQLSQFIHHVVDQLQSIQGITAIALGVQGHEATIRQSRMWIWKLITSYCN